MFCEPSRPNWLVCWYGVKGSFTNVVTVNLKPGHEDFLVDSMLEVIQDLQHETNTGK